MDSRWPDYLRKIARGVSGAVIARTVEVSESKVSYWFKGTRAPLPAECVRVARAFGQPPVEALVAAGYLNPGDVVSLGGERGDGGSLADYPSIALLDELRRREYTPR